MTGVTLNHLAIVVEDIESALPFWRDALGLEAGQVQDVPAEAVRVAFLNSGESHVELVQPVSTESGIGRYLASRGAGMHHVCFDVPDIEATMRDMQAKGVELINETPRERDGRKYAFIHPRSTGGVLVELYQRLEDDDS